MRQLSWRVGWVSANLLGACGGERREGVRGREERVCVCVSERERREGVKGRGKVRERRGICVGDPSSWRLSRSRKLP